MARKSRSRRNTRSSKRASIFNRRLLLICLIPLLLLGAATTVYLDHLVRSKFEGKKWSLPARVYARPLELYAGMALKQETLLQELRALGYQSSAKADGPGQYLHDGNWVVFHSRGFSFWDTAEAAQRVSVRFAGNRVAELADGRGDALPIMRLEPQEIGGIYPAHMEDRLLVRLQDIPPLLGETLIAVEDRDFRHHHGISPRGIARAALANLRAGGVVQGGSTLTQQLVKNFYLDERRSFRRKMTEAVMALLLDARYSKSEILETYLNEVYLGQSGPRGIHGFALGAQHYFRLPLRELDTAQIALLVGLVKGASYYNPWRNPERALERRNLVLDVMAGNGLISDAEHAAASRQPLGVVSGSSRPLYSYPAFIDLVKRQLQRDYQARDLQSEGLRVFTTLAPWVQRAAEQSLQTRLEGLEIDYSITSGTLQGAVVVEAVGSGEILAVVGDRQADYAGFNRALDARRSIGSLVKPAVYLAALSRPEEYTLITPVEDSPLRLVAEGGQVWEPRNFTRESHGVVPLYEALAQSYNQATARLGSQLGIGAVAEVLQQLGVSEAIPPLPSVFLGALDLSPIQVSNMYQTIASEGVYSEQRSILSVLDARGQPLNRYPLRSESRFDPAVMHLVEYGLKVTMREGTGRSAYRLLPDDLVLVGKTGTSNERRDSWFAGYSGDYLAVVWLGRDDNGPTPFTGATGALRVWADLFGQLPLEYRETVPPLGVDYLWVASRDASLGGPNCAGSELIPFVTGSGPQDRGRCSYQQNPVLRWLRDLVGPQ